MIRTVLLLFLISLLSSCGDSMNAAKSSKPEVELFDAEKIEIIQAIIEKANESSPKPPPAPLIHWPNESDEEYQLRVDSLIASCHAQWDTTTFVFVLEGKLHPVEYHNVSKLLDETFLIDSTSDVFNDSSDFFDVSEITEKGFVVIDADRAYAKNKDSLQNLSKEEGFNSLLSFSKMVFNKDRTKVVFLLNQYCGLYCGSGTLYKMIKEEEGWVVEEAILLWGA